MSNAGASLVENAKTFAKKYGDYAQGFEGAALSPWLRAHSLWSAKDAVLIAELFVENGSMLIGNTQMTSSAEICDYLEKSFRESDAVLEEEVVLVRPLVQGCVLVVSEGGFVTELDTAPDRLRSTWVVLQTGEGWRIFSMQLSPIG